MKREEHVDNLIRNPFEHCHAEITKEKGEEKRKETADFSEYLTFSNLLLSV